ncbi:hypothetical protein TNCT_546091 [Trichonephila clavata]|uniref:DNA-directed primase/polymerase protein n=1 Tax=Trichonephila clavata TaxID=2740835 RepID=A0A8X6H5X1_TRICU|nr:hypothetical protein TNCT_546091 [Trichonephila clavata]
MLGTTETVHVSNENPNVLADKFYKPISSTSSRTWSESILQLRKTYKEHKNKPIPSEIKSRLDGPSVSWKVFRHLNEATSYADNHTKECKVFSFEERTPGSSGQRLFLVTHPQHMWLNHKLRPLEERCTYEVIRDGAPCRLYFDLEFNKMFNPSKNGIKMTEIFIKCIIMCMLEEFNLKISTSDVLWLDASTEQKYSCHLILQLNDIAFKNNIEAGHFVSSLFMKIQKKIETNKVDDSWPQSEELKYMLVLDKDGKIVHFCDKGVYTKNRNFRMYLSTKYGKKAPLYLSEFNQYVPVLSASCKDLNEAIFYDSLVTYFRNGNNFSKLLNYDLDPMNERIPKSILQSRTKSESCGFTQNSKSPYPEVDNFVLRFIKDDIATGFIRKWSYIETEDILVYEIGSYRFCSNIGRHHKSNNIMIIVDMKRKIFYQKCHDPECQAQNYKSVSESLPESIISLYCVPEDFFDDNCFTQLNDSSENDTHPAAKNNVNEINFINNDFLEDLSLDSYPFTQLQNSKKDCNILLNEKVNSTEIINDEESLEKSFLEDTSLDDMCLEDMECNFAKCRAENENMSDEKDLIVSMKNSNDEEMSAEDEQIMIEAAAAMEVVMDGTMFSEETIF